MLKNTSPTKSFVKGLVKKCSVYSDNDENSSEDSYENNIYTPSRYYDTEMKFNFAETINMDMGIRFC